MSLHHCCMSLGLALMFSLMVLLVVISDYSGCSFLSFFFFSYYFLVCKNGSISGVFIRFSSARFCFQFTNFDAWQCFAKIKCYVDFGRLDFFLLIV